MLKKDADLSNLFKNYSKDILHYSLSLLRDYEEAEDAVQEVFTRFIESYDSFRGECSYKTWLLTITRNYCFNRLNGKARLTDRIDEQIILSSEDSIEQKITLEEVLEKLTKDEYELVYLREFACYSYKEISEILNISEDNVKVKIFRVRQQLKKYLR